MAKNPADRDALLRAVVSGNPKFFLGSDSAPHPVSSKFPGHREGKVAAGVFTQPYVTQLVISALEGAVERGIIDENSITKEKLEGFLGRHGREFYRIKDEKEEMIELLKGSEVVCEEIGEREVKIVPFRRGMGVWSVRWVK